MSDALPPFDVNAVDAWLKLNRIKAENAINGPIARALAHVFVCCQADIAVA